MPLQSQTMRQEGGLCFLSLDAGGSRAISQLQILAETMHRLNFDAHVDQKKLPRDVFDMIGGTGSGGFIAILLVMLGMTAQRALDAFIDLSVNILDAPGMDAMTRTVALEKHINILLEMNGIGRERRLGDSETQPESCKLVVLLSYNSNVQTLCVLRNFKPRPEQTANLTIAQALSATLSIPPFFTPMSVPGVSATFEYIGGDFKQSNPSQVVISEAYHAFGSEQQVACLLNIGCGHMGVLRTPENSDLESWNRFLDKLITDTEQEAQRIDAQMSHLGIYHRLRVIQGLQRDDSQTQRPPGEILTHTAIYLSDPTVSRNIDICVNSLNQRDGAVSLDQLKHSGRRVALPIPLPPLTKTFVMRRKPWEFVEKAMLGTDADNEPKMLAVTGIGGCGKTQLILKFMRVHKPKFRSMFFIDGSSESRIRADIIRHVRSLGTMHVQKSFEECLLFLAQPTSGSPRLLFYDNVDNPKIEVMPLFPDGDGCSIIITSRNRSIGALSPNAHLELDKMTTEEAIELLLSTNPSPSTNQARENALEIAEVLGCLPIALQQARSYMYHTKCSGAAYLERLSDIRGKLLSEPVKYQKEMRYLSTYEAFEASFGILPQREQQLLRLFSFLHWSRIPLELIILAAEREFARYEQELDENGEEFLVGKTLLEEIFLVDGSWNGANLDSLMASLQSHSLVTLVSGVDTMLLEIHPLLHGWLQYSLPIDEGPRYKAATALLVALGYTKDHTSSTQYLPNHVSHLSRIWEEVDINNRAAFGIIMTDSGHVKEGILLMESVVAVLQQRADSQTFHLSDSLWLLAVAYQKAGHFSKAVVLQEELLLTMRERHGDSHPHTIDACSNLATTYVGLGRLEEAKELGEEVRKLRRVLLGDSHLHTIDACNNLAVTYDKLGRLEEARVLQEEVLALRRELLGDIHLDTASASINLANTYRGLGRWDEAKGLKEEVLQLWKKMLGDRHPDTINASSDLALTYRDLGRLQEAKSLQEEALKLSREIMGDRHPDTITASFNLAAIYCDLDRPEEAKDLQEKGLNLRKEILGDRHPETISASSNLALTYNDLGRREEAKVLQEEVLKLWKEILGNRHPRTITASSNLALTYNKLNRLEEARVLQEEGLKLSRDVRGGRHPDTITASSNLALTYFKLGRLEAARDLQEEALKLSSDVLGKEDQTTCSRMINLAATYHRLSSNMQALNLVYSAENIIAKTLGTDHSWLQNCQVLKSSLHQRLRTAP